MSICRYAMLILVVATSMTSCRMRRDSSQSLSSGNPGNMKLFATCTSDSQASRYRNLIVQEDEVNLRGLLTLDNGTTANESQAFLSASLVIENRDSSTIRKIYTGKDLTFSIDLSGKENDIFSGRLKESKDSPEIVYLCAI